ncbi:conserved protein of unknown function [Pseudomonas putida KT2440]|uniref:Uncharacterized protein n=1 Tax=Pseudomonas putida (strain ATCC 47054 / DSM 6125 / CFBP 8728 / NCIMB 11950 / KT2440) TaxID=160488 RepID=A0A140FWA6_PSEPK|nr:conserved protein of unknown function [Pseudomonas putida KT2440]
MHATASLHVHPAAATIDLTFKVRRLAKQHGCAFVTTKRPTSSPASTCTPPYDGGHAA